MAALHRVGVDHVLFAYLCQTSANSSVRSGVCPRAPLRMRVGIVICLSLSAASISKSLVGEARKSWQEPVIVYKV
jgi:hypothetical protein